MLNIYICTSKSQDVFSDFGRNLFFLVFLELGISADQYCMNNSFSSHLPNNRQITYKSFGFPPIFNKGQIILLYVWIRKSFSTSEVIVHHVYFALPFEAHNDRY